MLLHHTQSQVAKDQHRFRVLCTGRRWGKTTLAVEEIKGIALSKNARIAYVAPTYQQARDIAWALLVKEMGPIVKKVNESRLELEVKNLIGGTSLIQLRGWEAIETLRGQHFDFIVLDEVAMMRNFWLHWQEVIRPTLTDTRGQAMFISTPKGFNHFYDLYNFKDKDQDYQSFHYTSYDNPHIPKDELDKAQREVTEDRFAQEYLADFRKTEGLVYKEFDRKRHIAADLPKNVSDTILGIDFGYTNPAAIIEIKIDSDRHYWITSEWYKTGQTTEQISEYATTLKATKVYPDPAEPDRIEILRRFGLNCREVSKDITAGIDSVRELFKQNRIHIHPDCKNLIWELETYRYPDKKPDQNEQEKPVKENDHACFVKGTKVNGNNIEKVGVCTGEKNVYEYLIGGIKITATPDHPVFTQRGFVPIDALKNDDIVWINKRFYTTGLNGIGIQSLLSGLIGITFFLQKRLIQASVRDCIDIFGEKKMVKSLRGIVSTTLTAIPRTIVWTISAWYSALNTLASIGLTRKGSGLKKTSKQLSSRLNCGLKQKRVGFKEKRWGTKMCTSYLKDLKLLGSVICVEKSIKPKATGEIDSVISTAVKRRFVGRELVYTLKTKSGMYRANGLLVSNCDALRYALYNQEPTPEPIDNYYATYGTYYRDN